MSRHHCLTKKIKTPFGQIFLHLDAASDGRVVTIGISQPGKHENTTLGDALHQIAEGLNQLIEEIEEIEV